MSSLYKQIQETNLNPFFIEKNVDNLNKVIAYLNDINKQYELINKNLNRYIKDNFTFPFELSDKFNKEINKYIEWIKNMTKNEQLKYIQEYQNNYNDLKDKFTNFYEKISICYKNNIINKISEFNENIKNLIEDLTEFDPPNINNYSYINISFDSKFDDSKLEQFYEEPDENKAREIYGSQDNISSNNSDENETSLKCYYHLDKKGIYYCSHCDYIFCEYCRNEIINYNEANNHSIQKIKDIIANDEEDKNKFLKSFITIFKDYLLKCNFIMNYKNINYTKHKSIIKKFMYPFLKNETNFQNQMDFLNDINEAYKIIEGKMDTTNISLNNSKMSELLTKYLKKELDIEVNTLDDIEDDFIQDEHYVIGDESEESENKEYDKIKNQFLYIVNLINKENYNLDNDKLNKEIIKKISQVLSIDKKNVTISTNNKREFINNFIKTESFSKLSPKKIMQNYSNLTILYDFKLLIDGLIRYKCQIPKNKLDTRYNFITPNLSLNNKRGTEKYIPPYGWLGIGLNVIDKYEKNNDWLNKNDSSSKWANCYYFFGKNLSSDNIINKLKDAIMNNVLYKDDKFQIKMNIYNKRIKDKKLQRIGIGYYLSNDINIAEKYTGTISFRDRKYKILLMAKVLIESIKEPDDNSFWIISKNEDIRIYKILFKEVLK